MMCSVIVFFAFLSVLPFKSFSQSADISLALTPLVSPACGNTPQTITLTVTNNGPDLASNITVNIKANGTHVTGSPMVIPSLSSGSNTVLNLPYSFPVPGKILISCDAAAAGPPDLVPANNTASQILTSWFNGTYSIGPNPGDPFSTIKMAVDTLNAYALCGPVVFNVAAGHSETSANITLNISGTKTNTITFQSAGSPNPVILSSAAGSGSNATASFMNYGDAFFRIAGGDYITINGIDVREMYTGTDPGLAVEYGYMICRSSATDGAKHVTIKNCNITLNRHNVYTLGIYQSNYNGIGAVTNPSSTVGIHDSNSYFSNVIRNVYSGIGLRGYNAASPFTLYDQNTMVGVGGKNVIANFGGGNQPAYGIYVMYQNAVNITNDSINGGDSTTASVMGIYLNTAANSGASVSFNYISLRSASTTQANYGIANSYGAGSGNKVSIYCNTIQSVTADQATTGALAGIYNNAAVDSLYINGNVIRNLSLSGSGVLTGIESGSPVKAWVHSNSISSLNKSGSGNLIGIRFNSSIIESYGNALDDFNAAATNSYIYGFYNIASPASEKYYNNSFNDFRHSGQGMVNGIYLTTTTSSRQVSDNTFHELYSADSTVTAIWLGTSKSQVYRNYITELESASNGTASYVSGIQLASGNKSEIYNNIVSALTAPALSNANAIRGIYLANTIADSVRVFYNTVYLSTSGSGATFGNAALYASALVRPDLRNNILINNSIPNGTAYASVLYFASATVANYVATSNSNCFYAGTPSAKKVIFANVATSDQTVAAFKSRVAPRDSASFTENVPFNNILTIPYDLHLSPSIPTLCESGGTRITSPFAVVNDVDQQLRFGETGYVGTGTAPDVGADEFDGIRLHYDLAATSLIKPRIKTCYAPNDTVEAAFQNVSSETINFASNPITFTATVFNGTATQTFNITRNSGVLKADSVIIIVFTNNAVMNVHGTYTVKAWHNWTSDQRHSNDTLKIIRNVTNPEIQTITTDYSTLCRWDPAQLQANVLAFGGGASQLNFTRDTTALIPDASFYTSSITVSGAGGWASDLVAVTIDSLIHPVDGDVDISLIAPDGSSIELSTDNGNAGSNYIKTVFRMDAATPVTTGTAPFTGSYLPEGDFATLSGNANGVWRLRVADDNPGNTGILYKWSLKLKAPNAISSYNWTPLTGLNIPGIANPVATPLVTTTYRLTATDQWGCVSLPDSIKITVNPAYRDTVLYELCHGDSLYTQGAWQHNSGYYTDNNPTLLGCDSITVRHIVVFPVYNDTNHITICLGDSVYAQGAWQHTAGLYLDHLHTSYLGCDSLVYTDLHVNLSYHNVRNITICNGDSVLAQGAWQHTTGVYTDNLQTVLGCDSITVTNLTVNPLPVVNLGHDTLVCWEVQVTLDATTPGCTYLWSDGETGAVNIVDSSEYWLGSHDIWVRVDNGCVNYDTIRISFSPCTGIAENEAAAINVFPNPTSDKLYIENGKTGNLLQIGLYNVQGQLLFIRNVNPASAEDLIEIDLTPQTPGVYYLLLYNGESYQSIPVIRN
jgi:subtilisin-like proprotein convertase family protein